VWGSSSFQLRLRACANASPDRVGRVGVDGAVVVADVRGEQVSPTPGVVTQEIKVRVPDVDAAFNRARDFGARVVHDPHNQLTALG
jgi:uncharacterized glyoxalase superfamily protein PhnB